MPETDLTSTRTEKSSSTGDTYPRPDRSEPSNVQARDGDPEKAIAGLASDHRETGAREDKDQNVIDLDGLDDPQNPINWPARNRWMNIILLSAMTLLTWDAPTLPHQACADTFSLSPFCSSMFAPAAPEVMQEFRSTNVDLASFVVSVYILGYAFGPLFIAPMSELYGRLPVCHVNAALFLVFNVGCAKSAGLPMLVVFRFLAGVAGSCPISRLGHHSRLFQARGAWESHVCVDLSGPAR
jgi:hypothetical protein